MRNLNNIYGELNLLAWRPVCEGKGKSVLYLKQVLSGQLESTGSK